MLIVMDFVYLEGVVNYLDVFYWVLVWGQFCIDLLFIWVCCVVCQFEGGGFVFFLNGDGVWEGYVFFLCCFKNVYVVGIEVFGYFFDYQGVRVVVVYLFDDVLVVCWLVIWIGFQFQSNIFLFFWYFGDVLVCLYVLIKERF